MCHTMRSPVAQPRGFRDLNPARKVGLFFSAFVDGLSNYVIRHPIQIWKYDIIAMPFPETMHKRREPMFWAPGRVLHKLDDTRIQINVSDRLFPKIKSNTCPSCLQGGRGLRGVHKPLKKFTT